MNESGRFVDDIIQQIYKSVKSASSIMNTFTILTIVILVMGVFAMSLYLVRQREKEIIWKAATTNPVNALKKE